MMAGKKNMNYWILATAACGLAAIVVAATCVGLFVGMGIAGQNSLTTADELKLKAATAARGKTMSMATGLIDTNVEALFVLDHDTGNLQCWLLNSRTGDVGGIYRTNVLTELQVDKTGEPDLMLVTGAFFWSGGVTGTQIPARSVVYVGDSSTGNIVGYTFTYNKQAMLRGGATAGALSVICKGTAKEGLTRDQ